jgi:hypothetical protein
MAGQLHIVPGRGAGKPARAIALGESALLCLLLLLFLSRALLPAWDRLNTDFPNYYLAAKLYRSGYPLERIFDWVWFQRQKDQAGIDWGVVGWGPLSPFSALVLAPLASLSALATKRIWLSINIFLLAGTIVLLRAMTGTSARRLAIIVFVTVVPLRTNFEFGQQYVLILFLLTLAAWLYGTERTLASAAALAIASALKLYPGFFVLFFLFKHLICTGIRHKYPSISRISKKKERTKVVVL